MQAERTKPHMVNMVCPYCQTSIQMGDSTVVCSCCKMPHHLDCWRENGQCTTYGCKGEYMNNVEGMRAYRKQRHPIIEISFDDPEKNNLMTRLRVHSWKVAALVAILLGSSYYLYRIFE